MDSECAEFGLKRIIGVQSEKSTEGFRFRLNNPKAYSCGRCRTNDIVCNSEVVSRIHCIFVCFANEIYLQDLNSRNGVYVNGKQLLEKELFKLQTNDIIGIGTSDQSSDNLKKFIYQFEKEIVRVENSLPTIRKRKVELVKSHSPVKLLNLMLDGTESESNFPVAKNQTEVQENDILEINLNENGFSGSDQSLFSFAMQSTSRHSSIITQNVESDNEVLANDENQYINISKEPVRLVEYDSSDDEYSNFSDKEIVEDDAKNIKSEVETQRLDIQFSLNEDESRTLEDKSKVLAWERKADDVLSQILAWNPEDFKIDNNFNFNLESFPKNYNSYQEYCEVLIFHLLIDVAHKIRKAEETVDQISRTEECTVIKDSNAKTMINRTKSPLLEFDLSVEASNQNELKTPVIGDLLCLEILNENNSVSAHFALTKQVKKIKNKTNQNQTVIISVIIQLLDFDISEIRNFRVIRGLNVALTIRLVQAIVEFESSLLMPLIINPDYAIDSSRLQSSVKNKQSIALMKIINAIESQEPKICIIEGGPGTGKTKIIGDTIFKVLLSGEIKTRLSSKILVCAKGEAEVDEIVLRVSEIKNNFDPAGAIRMIRVGQSESANEHVNNFSLETLGKHHVELGIREFLLSDERYTREKSDYFKQILSIAAEHTKLINSSIAIKMKILETCYAVRNSGRNVRDMNHQEILGLLTFAENTLVSEANVIVSTLSMCLSNQMDAIFGSEEEVPICIIDNASQISEIEVLKPLTFGVKTLVMLGDPYTSYFIKNGYSDVENLSLSNTLFSRLKSNFEGKENNSLISLNVQYRINKRVMLRINKIFCNGDLKSKHSDMKFPMFPCRVFNLYSNRTVADEELFVSNLISTIIEFMDFKNIEKPLSIGVIVPDAGKLAIMLAVEKRLSTLLIEQRKWFSIHVDTISGFKNQERDVIIVSCTKGMKNMEEYVEDEWLYAAISRVKHSLILYGSFNKPIKNLGLQWMVKNRNWKKSHFVINDDISPLKLKEYIMKCNSKCNRTI